MGILSLLNSAAPISYYGQIFEPALKGLGKLTGGLIELVASIGIAGIGVGLGIVVFSLLLKLIVLPFDVMQRVNMRKQNVKMQENKEKFEKLAVYDNPGRIAAFRDGSIWRMVIVVYGYEFPEEPVLRLSSESVDLRFFTKEELKEIEIAVTHADIVQDLFVEK